MPRHKRKISKTEPIKRQDKMNRPLYLFFIIAVFLLLPAGCGDRAFGGGDIDVIGIGDDKVEDNTMDEKDQMNVNTMKDKKAITSFWYTGVLGTGSGFAYNVTTDPDGYLAISYFDAGFVISGASNEVSIPLSCEKYYELARIVEEYDLASWDGWGQNHDTSIVILDGGGFTLKIDWSDGISVFAKSQPPFPENYLEAEEALLDFFNTFFGDWLRANGLE